MVTGERITDEEIVALYDDNTINAVDLHIANRRYCGDGDKARQAERARCAAILNARIRASRGGGSDE